MCQCGLIRDGEKGGRGHGGVGGGGEREIIYRYRYTVTTKIIPALRWAAMRAILLNVSVGELKEVGVLRPVNRYGYIRASFSRK